jgi:hypothetical protein
MGATWSQLMPTPRSASRRTMAWARSTRSSLMRDSSAAWSGVVWVEEVGEQHLAAVIPVAFVLIRRTGKS